MFDAAAFEKDLGEFVDVKELLTAQMIVPLRNSGGDAVGIDLCCDSGIFRPITIDVDFAHESRKFAVRCSQELVNSEADARPGRIEFVDLFGPDSGTWADNYACGDKSG